VFEPYYPWFEPQRGVGDILFLKLSIHGDYSSQLSGGYYQAIVFGPKLSAI
jgi:hypothetical protein